MFRPIADLEWSVQIDPVRLLRIKIRTILVFTALVALVADGTWLAFHTRSDRAAFLLQPTQTSFVDGEKNPEAFPAFDPVRRKWLFRGKLLSSLKNFIQNSDPERLGPDSIGNFVAIRFPENMVASSLRPAFLSLSNQGICKFAALGFGQSALNSGFPEGTVYVIASVQDDQGRARLCREKINY